jgi:uncharacterized protein (TIRG00374 family)
MRRWRSWRPVAWVLDSELRRAVAVFLAAVFLVGVAFLLVGRHAHFGKIADAARRAHQSWFPLCLAGKLLAYVGYVMAYRDVARADGGPRIGVWSIFRIVIVGFGAFVVGSSAAGLAVDYWALRRAGAGPHESTRRVLALNTLQWAVIAAAAALSALLLLVGLGGGAPPGMELPWLVIVPTCVAAAVWTTQSRRVGRLTAVPPRSDAREFTQRARRSIRVAFADAIGGVALVRHIITHPREYPAALAGFPVYWFGDLLTLYAALRAFGVHLDPASLVLAYTTTFVLTAVPLPAGGSGGIEASLALTLHLLGAPLAPALLGVVVYRLFSFWLPVLPALAFLPTVKQLRRDVHEASRQSRDPDSERPLADQARA